MANGMKLAELAEALDLLQDRMREVIELRYGLDGSKPATLEQVGERLGVTRERVRQVEGRALREMAESHPGLRDYLRAEVMRRGSERRRFVRVADEVIVSVTRCGEADAGDGRTLNFSVGGVLLALPRPFPAGTELESSCAWTPSG